MSRVYAVSLLLNGPKNGAGTFCRCVIAASPQEAVGELLFEWRDKHRKENPSVTGFVCDPMEFDQLAWIASQLEDDEPQPGREAEE